MTGFLVGFTLVAAVSGSVVLALLGVCALLFWRSLSGNSDL